MDKTMQLLRLAQGLRQAGRHRDWRALQRLDVELAAALRGWVPPVAPSTQERQVLQALDEAHAEARQLCSDEMQALQQTLNQMREGRERWRAYAAHGGQQLEDQP
ncbi:MAG: hypothetical protein GXC94_04670 [Comamonadaceae bacterium]|jgi:uncharacterized protein YeaO (DUF488 family)|nr:hypothetical protein [Comamonadaceae bacterium]